MEVHAHTHTPRKKWTHYLWEFLMLFLAVFCGFLAENQREHYVEHKREKQYMRSMIEDLMLDTAEVDYKIKFLDSTLLPLLKKSIKLLYAKDFSDSAVKEMYDCVPRSTHFVDVNFEDRTISQLKNSGNLRLIRNKEITDSLAAYWKTCDDLTDVLLPGYENARLIVKDISYSLFDFTYYEANNPFSKLRSELTFKLVSNDEGQLIKLANYISNLNAQAFWVIRSRFLDANREATNLITLIKHKYHLK